MPKSVRVYGGAALWIVVAVGLLTGAAAASMLRNADSGQLTVLLAGPVGVSVSVKPAPAPGSASNPCREVVSAVGCTYTLPQGPVELSAEPAASFAKWSDPSCGSNPVCATTVTERSSVVAMFKPVHLVIEITGKGTVQATPSGTDCGPSCAALCKLPNQLDRCIVREYATPTEVELEAKPDPPATAIEWSSSLWCDPGPDRTVSRCRTEVNWNVHLVGVGLGGAMPPSLHFGVHVVVRVLRQGDGGGTVTGYRENQRIINCGTDCSEELENAKRVELRADPDDDSTFARWVDVCSTNRTCEFNSGTVTLVRAVFERKKAPPPTTTTSTTTTATTTTATTAPAPKSAPMSVRIAQVSGQGGGARRAIVLTVVIDRPGRASVRLLRRAKALSSGSFGLAKGRNALRLRLPRAVGPGWYQLSLRVVAGNRTRTLTRPVRIRP